MTLHLPFKYFPGIGETPKKAMKENICIIWCEPDAAHSIWDFVNVKCSYLLLFSPNRILTSGQNLCIVISSSCECWAFSIHLNQLTRLSIRSQQKLQWNFFCSVNQSHNNMKHLAPLCGKTVDKHIFFFLLLKGLEIALLKQFQFFSLLCIKL